MPIGRVNFACSDSLSNVGINTWPAAATAGQDKGNKTFMVEASFTPNHCTTPDVGAQASCSREGYFDTVGVYFNVSPNESQLLDWYGGPNRDPDRNETRGDYKKFYRLDPGVFINFYYHAPNSLYPEPRLGIQTSFPKILFGNNIDLVGSRGEINQVVQILNDRFSGLSWLPEIDFGKGLLERVDLTYNHPVGDQVQDQIRAISSLHLSGHTTHVYPPSGVQFRSNASSSTFYNKRLECKDPRAEGILRQEFSLRHHYFIAKQMDKGGEKGGSKVFSPSIQDLTPDFARENLRENLRALHLDDCLVVNHNIAADMLIRHYGLNTASYLLGYLNLRRSMSRDQLIGSGLSQRTIQRWEKMLVVAHVSPVLIDEQSPLLPLRID